MKKLKVMTVLGTRPEIIRLSEVMKKLDKFFEHIIVHTGQNYDYELSEVFFNDLGIRQPNHFLEAAAKTPAETVGLIIARTESILEKEKPEAVLVLGDTNSCMAAYAARRHHIPVFHMEAGNRCFDNRVPEEINRKIIDHMSDINMVYSDLARQNLLREGLLLDRIIKTGSPMFEVLNNNIEKIDNSKALTELGLSRENYLLLSAHREENVDSPVRLARVVEIIEELSSRYNVPVVFSMHPRTSKRLRDYNMILPKNVISCKPFGFFDFVHLEKNASCVISDSGTISEEASILGIPAVNLRESHERQEAMDRAVVPMTGLNIERVVQAVDYMVRNKKFNQKNRILPDGYDQPDVSDKVVKIILSYRDYVVRVNSYQSLI